MTCTDSLLKYVKYSRRQLSELFEEQRIKSLLAQAKADFVRKKVTRKAK